MVIEIGEELLNQIRKHGTFTYPKECCGALLGRVDKGERRVVDLLSLDNRRKGEAARKRYRVAAVDHFRVEKIAEKKGLEILGFYHTHPDHPARPSEFDREHALPWYSYLILSVFGGAPGEITCWQLAEDRCRFEMVPIKAIPMVELTE